MSAILRPKFVLTWLMLSLCTFVLFQYVQAQDSTEDTKKPIVDVHSEVFRAAVQEEVAKTFARMGNGNLVDFSKELLKKEEQIKLRELELQKREEEISLTMQAFEKKLTDFQGEQQKFLACIEENDKKHSKRISHMVNVISGMKPKTAAEVLSVQDSDISVQILGMLEPVKVSKIFNLMDKEISARLQKQYMTMKR